MRIILVRHGEPNYELDCLTETGKAQAVSAANRLAGEGISEIFASPQGRARQTAMYTAEKLGLPVTTLDFMHEIAWGGENIPERGHPWTLAYQLITREDYDFMRRDWRSHPYFRENAATACFYDVTRRFDAFLAGRGYRREGLRYFCVSGGQETIAIFSHGGSGTCVLAHLLSLPFPYASSVMGYDFTGITILELPCAPGEYVYPRLELFNDQHKTF